MTVLLDAPAGGAPAAAGANLPPIVLSDSAAITEDTLPNPVAGIVLANDSDGDGPAALVVSQVNGLPGNVGVPLAGTFGSLTSGADGSFSYTLDNTLPSVQALAAGQQVQEVFTYQAFDGLAATASTLTITITGTNDAPLAIPDINAITEDAVPDQVGGNLLVNDSDVDGPAALVVSQVGGSSGNVGVPVAGTFGSLTLGADGANSYTLDNASPVVQALAAGQQAQEVFAYTAFDGLAGTVSTLTITVTGTNDLPVAVDDDGPLFTTDQDTAFTTGSVLTNDSDPDTSDLLAVQSLDITGTLGLVTSNGDGTFAYDPNGQFDGLAAGESATDSFSYTVSDGNGGSDTATVTVSIDGANNLPEAVDDDGPLFTTDQDTAFTTGSVLTNDSDPDTTDVLAVQSLDTTGALGLVTSNGDGTFEYDPNGQFESLAYGESTTDSFSYTVSDGNGGSDTATVTVTIDGVNDLPEAVDDDGPLFTTDEDTAFTTGSVLVNDSDPDTSDTLAVQSLDITDTLGLVTDNGDGTFEYDPNGQFESLAYGESTTDSFSYTVSDGNGGSDTATVTVTVDGVNDLPEAVDDDGPLFTTDEDTAFTTGSVLVNDSDPDTSDTLAVQSLDTTGTLGLVTDNGDGTFEYDPNGRFDGLAYGESTTDSFDYTVSDGNGGSDTATVTVTVDGVNDLPEAVDDSRTTDEDNPVSPIVTANDSDADGDDLEVLSIDDSGVTGTVTVEADDDTITYDPDGQFEGLGYGESAIETFSYTVTDGNGGTATASVEITIEGVNDAPEPLDDPMAGQTFLTEALVIPVADLLANDGDPEDDGFSLTRIVGATNGTATLDVAAQTVIFVAAPGFVGAATFTYEVEDDGVPPQSATAVATVDVTSVIELSGVESGDGGFVINGVSGGDESGFAVSGAGDVNGDGLDDLIVGARYDDPNGGNSGASFVVFGAAGGGPIELSQVSLGVGGFVINGVSGGDQSGFAVSGAGDVNGDGLDDLIVGAPYDDPDGSSSGASFVVFGKAGGAAVELSQVQAGTGGFAITGDSRFDQSGYSVSGAGDVNGDGLDDLIVGANADAPNGGFSGASYVVFGKADGSAVDLTQVKAGNGGFVINGIAILDFAGTSVSDAGDVNGDGLADLIVGVDRHNGSTSYNHGAAFVVFGKTGGGAVELSDLDSGTGGFAINGGSPYDYAGFSVSGAGDTNGDGLDDLIVGAYGDDPNGSRSGASYVVFGKASGTTVELSQVELGNGGFVIDGVSGGDESGRSVSVAGDVNGDGLDDLIVGAREDDPNGDDSGAAFVVFGKADTTAVELSDIGTGPGGFVLNGIAGGDTAGISVSGAGDVNGDGFADLIVGANGDDPNGDQSGASFVVFGGNFTGSVELLGAGGGQVLTGDAAANVINGAQGDDTLVGSGGADVLFGGAGDDVLAVTGTDFARLQGGNGTDSLRLDGGGALNLTAIADNRIEDIEAIDLGAGGAADAATLTLNLQELLNLSTGSNRLLVTGDASDSVDPGGLTDSGVDEMVGGITFDVYTDAANGVGEQLLIQQGIMVV